MTAAFRNLYSFIEPHYVPEDCSAPSANLYGNCCNISFPCCRRKFRNVRDASDSFFPLNARHTNGRIMESLSCPILQYACQQVPGADCAVIKRIRPASHYRLFNGFSATQVHIGINFQPLGGKQTFHSQSSTSSARAGIRALNTQSRKMPMVITGTCGNYPCLVKPMLMSSSRKLRLVMPPIRTIMFVCWVLIIFPNLRALQW